MAGAQWVLDGYTLPLAALLLTAGAAGDRIGLRRMMLGGIAVFTAASAACASAPDAAWLIGTRAVQGAGAAALLPATLAVIPHLFPGRADRDRATLAWVAAGAGFWLAERRGRHPMLPLSFLRHRVRTVAVISAGLMGFVFYGTLFVMSLYFQQFRGGSAGAAGVALLPLTVSSTVGPLLLYRPLSRRYGHAARPAPSLPYPSWARC